MMISRAAKHYRPFRTINTLLIFAIAASAFTIDALSQKIEKPVAANNDDQFVSRDSLPPRAKFRVGTNSFRPAGTVGGLAISPDGRFIVSMGTSLEVWDAGTGLKKWGVSPSELKFGGSDTSYGVKGIAFSDDIKHFYTPGGVNEFVSWELETGTPTITKFEDSFSHLVPKDRNEGSSLDSRTPKYVDVTANGKMIALGSSQGVIVGRPTGEVLFKFANHPDKSIYGLNNDRLTFNGHYCVGEFSPDGKLLAVVTSDAPQVLNLISTNDFSIVRAIQLTGWLVRLDFSLDGKQIAVTERDEAVRLYDVASGNEVWSKKIALKDIFENYTSSVTFSPEGQLIAVGATDKAIYVLNAKTGEQVKRLVGHGWYPWALVFSPNGQTLYSSGWDSIIRRWDLTKGDQLDQPSGVHASGLAAASPTTNQIAITDDRDRIYMLDSSTGIATKTMAGENASSMEFSADGRLFAAGGRISDELWLSVWNTATYELVHTWKWPRGPDLNTDITAIAFDKWNMRIAAVSFRRNVLFLCDLETGNVLSEIKHRNVHDVSFSPIDKSVVTAGWDSHIRFWNSTNGDSQAIIDLEKLPGERPNVQIYHVDYSPDGRFVAAGHGLTVSLWDTSDFSLRNQFVYHPSGGWGAGDMSFSPDGLWLCTGEMSSTVKLWDPFTGQKVFDVGKHASNIIKTVRFGSNGRSLLSGSRDGFCYLWDIGESDSFRAKDLESLWKDLCGNAASASYDSYWELVHRGDEAVALIERKLNSETQVIDTYETTRYLSPEEATKRLEVIEKALQTNPSAIRLGAVTRAVAMLAAIATDRAKQLLLKLAESTNIDDAIQVEAIKVQGAFPK